MSTSADFFPIAVWLQAPRNAKRFREAGINLYVGLWKGPTAEQLRALKAAQMPVICSQNEVGLSSPNADIIVGWMHGDEPDNAQPRAGGGYGPPIPPQRIVATYRQLRERDPSRPVLLNLGQGVAFDQYVGRGTRTNHPEDYPKYLKGCDIASFDIYPAVHRKPEVFGKLEFVPKGVERLRRWSDDRAIVWNCIEASRIGNVNVKPTPDQIRSEVWMSLIRGSRGIIYFVHQFQPRFREASLLDDPELLAAVTQINRRIRELAPALNSPSLAGRVTTTASRPETEIATMVKAIDDVNYLFAANMTSQATTATFELNGMPPELQVDVLDEDRQLATDRGQFQDRFEGYGVHLYRLDSDN